MGYSKSKRAIRRVEEYLIQLERATTAVEFPSDNPAKLAYHIREGIKTSAVFATDQGKKVEPFATYAHLATKFIVRVHGSKVACELRDAAYSQGRESLGTMSIPDVSDTLGIIGAAIKHKAKEMVFPSANRDTIEAARIHQWAEKNGYHLIVSDQHITLTKNEVGALEWKP